MSEYPKSEFDCKVYLHYRSRKTQPDWINVPCSFLRLPVVGEYVFLNPYIDGKRGSDQNCYRVEMVYHIAQTADEESHTETWLRSGRSR